MIGAAAFAVHGVARAGGAASFPAVSAGVIVVWGTVAGGEVER